MPETIDAHLPDFDFRQRSARNIAAPRADVWAALTSVTMSDPRLTRSLMAVRHFGRTAPPARPIFTHGPVTLLHVENERIGLAGKVTKAWRPVPMNEPIRSLAEFDAFVIPGWVKFLTSFELTDTDGGVCLATETRGVCTDARSRRLFHAYWTAIRPGAELVRRDILATVAEHATHRSSALSHARAERQT